MKPALQLRVSQHLALTPQLQQSIRLLQLSSLELQLEIGQMLEANPFLELEEDSLSTFEESLLTPTPLASPKAETSELGSESSEPAEPTQLGEADFGTTERDDWENGTERDDFDGIRETPTLNNHSVSDDDDSDGYARDAQATNLQDHLLSQLAGMHLSAEDRAAIEALVDSLNEDGYLADSLDEIVNELLQRNEVDESVSTTTDPTDDPQSPHEWLHDRLRLALRWLQSLDPAGVGARDLRECLQLQLQRMTPNPERELALQIVTDHLDLLGRRDTKKLLAITQADEQSLRWAQDLIRQCTPKPGLPFASTPSPVVIPDVVVQRTGRGFRVVLNPDVMPRLRINDLYASALRGQGRSNASPLTSHLQDARWFIKNIQQRFDTILRVSSAIVERQKNFFVHGEIAMKPLVLREIADELGLHESTISRVTTAKYMATPMGTFELKYFFGSGLSTEAGSQASSTAVRALIKQLIAAENSKKPLSDSRLSDMLSEQGINVARRTVAKYREALKIAPANLRKAI